MKKSQVLAALALAFALGVVAPIASVVNSADTYAVEYNPTRQASYCDVQNAISAVSNLEAYRKYEQVYNLIETWNDDDLDAYYNYTSPSNVTLSLPLNDSTMTYSDIATALQSAINGVMGVGYTSSNDLNVLTNEALNIHFSNVNKGDFTSYVTLFEWMTTNDSDLVGKEEQFKGIINGVSAPSTTGFWSASSLKSYVLGANGTDGQPWARTNEYQALAPVIAAYKNALTYQKYTSDLTKALQALVGFENVTLTNATINDANNVTKNADPIRALVNGIVKAQGVTGFGYFDMTATNPVFVNGYAKLIYYTKYATEHAQLRNGGVNDANRDMIDNIGNAYEQAVALVPGASREFKTLMTAYNGTCGQTNTDTDNNDNNNNQGGGTNNGGNTTIDPNAPDTGILADGEANASTTVAMVAGIATALTAAGAGVVAYRNARRSTRK